METDKRKFNATEVLAVIREARAVRRKRCTWGKSKLTKFLAELIQLRASGASLADIQYWLKKEKRVKADCTTIKRCLDKHISTPDQS